MNDAAAVTVDALLAEARACGLDRLDAQLLLAHAAQRRREWVLAHGDDRLDAELTARVRALFDQRADAVPLAYLVGQHEFHGLRLAVRPGVLDPRADTEVLVDWALDLLAGPLADRPAPEVLDLGTGSGAIALAVARACPRARVAATDRSAQALAVAQANGLALGLAVEWRAGDWLGAVPGRRFDLLLSNPPYLAADDPHLPALRHEPREALVADDDGLADLHRLADTAGVALRPGGWLLLEHGATQAEAVVRRLSAAGFADIATRTDLAGRPRCTGGRWDGGR